MQSIITLADLIKQVESNGNHESMRFEPSYTPQSADVTTAMVLNKCNRITAEILCKISYGYYQIMGNNLIAMGLSVGFFDYLWSDARQDQMFNRYCIRNNCEYTLEDVINDESKRLDFARKYNGPGNFQAYSDRMIDIYKGI